MAAHATPAPASGEPFSVELLLHRIEEFENSSHLRTIHQLQQEIQAMEQAIVDCRSAQAKSSALVGEAYETMMCMYDTITRYGHQTSAIRREWLASWGIHIEQETDLSSESN